MVTFHSTVYNYNYPSLTLYCQKYITLSFLLFKISHTLLLYSLPLTVQNIPLPTVQSATRATPLTPTLSLLLFKISHTLPPGLKFPTPYCSICHPGNPGLPPALFLPPPPAPPRTASFFNAFTPVRFLLQSFGVQWRHFGSIRSFRFPRDL